MGCLVCFLLGIGCVAAFGIFVAKGTGDAKPDADAFLVRLQNSDAAGAWHESHPEFRSEHSQETLASVMQRTSEVMGPLTAWNLTGTFVESNTGGKFVRLTYAGTFGNGAGTITVVMKGSPEGRRGYQMHSFNIASPLFDKKAACPNCSYPCEPGTRFCPKCGAALEAEVSGAAPAEP